MTISISAVNDAEDGSSGLLGSLPLILWQRRWLILVPAAVIALVAIAAAFLLPRNYRSSAVLLVESQNLPGGTTGGDDNPIDRRMAKIRQQILSRPDLVDLIQTNNLYDAASRSQPLSKLVDKMRNDTTIAAVDADIQRTAPGRSSSGSIAFSLSFDYPHPAQAQLVAQTFVDRLMKLDATSSQAEAQANVNYLQDQESGLQAQVSAIEAQINHITGINGAALSSAGVSMIGARSGIDYATQIATLQRENAQLTVQSGTAVERDPNVAAAEAQLAAAKAIYSDQNPDVRLAESRLAAARANSKNFQTRGMSSVVQNQIAANNTAIQRLNAARSSEESRDAAMVAAQARGPAVAQQVSQLQARADVLRTNLGRISSSLLNARSMSKLVDEQRGERLLLIDPPVTPDQPTSPNRPLFVFGGIFGGLAVGLALALLTELIYRPIRSVGQITSVFGEPPLGVVPFLSIGKDVGRPRHRKRWFRRAATVSPGQ